MDAVMLARQRMLEREGEHVCRVILASVDAERRRKDRNNAKAKRFYARKSPEEKLELSRRKRGRMKELHGEGYYYGLSKAWRGTEKGKAQVTSYNRSESHRLARGRTGQGRWRRTGRGSWRRTGRGLRGTGDGRGSGRCGRCSPG